MAHTHFQNFFFLGNWSSFEATCLTSRTQNIPSFILQVTHIGLCKVLVSMADAAPPPFLTQVQIHLSPEDCTARKRRTAVCLIASLVALTSNKHTSVFGGSHHRYMNRYVLSLEGRWVGCRNVSTDCLLYMRQYGERRCTGADLDAAHILLRIIWKETTKKSSGHFKCYRLAIYWAFVYCVYMLGWVFTHCCIANYIRENRQL